MKRIGIRLGAGIAVICLGSLAVFQARSDKDADDAGWPSADKIAAETPPAPLGMGDWPQPPDSQSSDTLVRGNDASNPPLTPPAANQAAAAAPGWSTAAADSGIRLASHDEELAFPDQPTESAGETAAAGFDLPAPLESGSDPAAAASGHAGFGFANPLGMSGAEMPSGEPAPPVNGALPAELAAHGAAESAAADDPAALPEGLAATLPSTMSAATTMPPADTPPEANSQTQMTLSPVGSGAIDAEVTADAAPQSVDAAGAAGDISANDPAPYADFASQADLALQGVAPLPGDAAQGTDAAQGGDAAGPGDAVDMAASSWGQPPVEAPQVGSAAEPFAPLAPAAAPAEGLRATAPAELKPTRTARAEPSASGSPAMTIGAGSASSMTQLVDPVEVLAQPGERRLEGAQTPTVVIQKRAPAEVSVGKPADFIISVRNVGTVAALDVRVFDSVPTGTELVETVPPAEAVQNMLAWQLGDLKPGEERTIRLKLMPKTEGEIGSVARVTFEAAASVRTMATKPVLTLEQHAPQQVLIGQQIEIEVELANTGSGGADNLVLQTDIPEGLEHPMGRQLDNLIGTMPPGDLRRQVLRLRATKPGSVQNVVRLTGPDGVMVESVVDIDVVSPTLQVNLAGPSMRYLERQTTYNVKIANTGTANASEIDLVAYLDSGLKFVSTDFEGQYDPSQHAVFWSLAELSVGQSGEVPLTLLPVEAGDQSVRLEAKADLGIAATSEKKLAIATLAELTFSIADDQDPIETGTETVYEIRVQNTGSRDDSNVKLEVQLPHPAMELVSADPSAGTDGRGRVVFSPIARIPAKGDQVFHIRVRGNAADTQVIRATLTSDQSGKPVTKEESTTVYSGQ